MNEIKIPKKFRLMGEEITVEFDNFIVHKHDAYGLAIFGESKIKLQDATDSVIRPKECIEHTYLHELVHFILHFMEETELKSNEKFVDVFSGLLHQALQTSDYETGVLDQGYIKNGHALPTQMERGVFKSCT